MKRIATLLVLLSAGLFTISGCEKPAEKNAPPATEPAATDDPAATPADDAVPGANDDAPADDTAPADDAK